MSSWTIRCATREDLEAVLELWCISNARATVTDGIEPLRSLLEADPRAVLVADDRAQPQPALAGSLIAAWNGWRGSFYRLAVHPAHRRHGLARRLVAEGEKSLRERGAIRLDAIVATEDSEAIGFWSAAGYERQPDRARFVRNI